MNMNAQELAAKLDGREYRHEITKAEAEEAAAAGLVVLFGASDDLAEFRGAIYDEPGTYEGAEILIHNGKIFEDEDCSCGAHDREMARVEREARTIKAIWCPPGGASWTYKTDIPHATFKIVEDGEVYCVGIVFALADAANRA